MTETAEPLQGDERRDGWLHSEFPREWRRKGARRESRARKGEMGVEMDLSGPEWMQKGPRRTLERQFAQVSGHEPKRKHYWRPLAIAGEEQRERWKIFRTLWVMCTNEMGQNNEALRPHQRIPSPVYCLHAITWVIRNKSKYRAIRSHRKSVCNTTNLLTIQFLDELCCWIDIYLVLNT